ncbi:hypothetical protein PV325_008103, partial [Microctonus aethiopoides]
SEFKNWLEYAPVCLDGVLKKEYVHHIAQLAEAIHILNKDSITSEELNKHGAEWGPIWVHSASNFESWNKKIMDKVTSANGRTQKIVIRYMLSTFLDTVICDDSLCRDTKGFIMEVRKTVFNSNIDVSRFIFVGKAETRLLTEDEKRMLTANGFEMNFITCFKAVRINGIEYRCKELQNSKRCNSIMYCETTGFRKIIAIIKFKQAENSIQGMFVKKLSNLNFAFNTKYIHIVAATDDITFIDMRELIKPAFTIDTPQCIYAMKFANCWETD